jgi:non-heme chloroperoxidase
MIFFASRGFRVIAHDRRGHGRSTQTWDGNEMDTHADDLLALAEALDLKNAVHVGHSTGGGEVARYIGRHGAGRAKGRMAKAVLPGAVPPLQIGARADRVTRGVPAIEGDVLLFSSGHFLRVVAAGWLGLEPGAARYFFPGAASLSVAGFRPWDEMPREQRISPTRVRGSGEKARR